MRFLALFLLLTPLTFSQSRAFKDFDIQGKKLFKEGKYQEALQEFKAAYKENDDAGRYKDDGNFFENSAPLLHRPVLRAH